MVELDTFRNLALSRRWEVHLFEFVNIQLFSKKNETNIFILDKRDLASPQRQMSPSCKLEIAFVFRPTVLKPFRCPITAPFVYNLVFMAEPSP
jgi:hypothetical protein